MKKFVCPMHPEIVSGKPGKCGICGMDLVLEEMLPTKLSTYKPLLIIISLIFLVSFATSGFNTLQFMRNFMAGFFLVFSGFKLLDLKGFVNGYATYDLLGRKVYSYGLLYPFIELLFGISYLLWPASNLLNWFVILVMGFSGAGVLESILKKRKFQCACLGTIIKVPLSEVTLIEDFGMAIMAAFLLLNY